MQNDGKTISIANFFAVIWILLPFCQSVLGYQLSVNGTQESDETLGGT